MSWLGNLYNDVSKNLKKEWGMSETNATATTDTSIPLNTGTGDAPAQAAPTAAAPAEPMTPVTTDVATPTTTAPVADTPAPVVTTVATSTISEISTKLEAAMKELETFVSAKDSHIAMAVAVEADRVKAAAESAWQAAVKKHQGVIQSLSDELGAARTDLENKLKSLVSSL